MGNELDKLFDLIWEIREIVYNLNLPFPEYDEVNESVSIMHEDLCEKIRKKYKMEDSENDN